jgi:hypothetical protein
MSTTRLVTLANQAVGQAAARSIRVLTLGTQTPAPAADVPPDAAPEPTGPVHGREDASDGYRQALAALQATRRSRATGSPRPCASR